MNSETTQSSVGMVDLMAWLEVNKKRLAMAGGVAVLVILVVMVVRWSKQQTETSANAELFKVKAPASAGEKTESPDPAAYLKVAEQYPSTDAAERASILAAGALFDHSKYSEAQAQFERFLQQHGDSSLAPIALYGKATSIEAQGKPDEALAAYQNVITRFGRSSVADDAKLASARIYETKNQPQQALRIYDELTGPNAGSSSSSEATTRKQYLLSLHPELAKTNAPVVPSTTAVSIPTNAVKATKKP